MYMQTEVIAFFLLQIQQLQTEMMTLKEILRQDSSNSSLPPSLDKRKKKAKKKINPPHLAYANLADSQAIKAQIEALFR